MMHSPSKSKQPQSKSDISTAATSDNSLRKRKTPDDDFTHLFKTFTLEIKATISNLQTDMSTKLSEINQHMSTIRCDLDTLNSTTSEIKAEINSLRNDCISTKKRVSELEDKQQAMYASVTDIQSSAQFCSDQLDDVQKRLSLLEKSSSNGSQVTNKMISLESKIEYMEQQARQCNIELTNVPERRGENLNIILETIGSKINYPIQHKEIISVHRVPQAQQSDRPKNIIIKMQTRTLRDNILSAFRASKGLKTDELGIAGPSRAVYMNEHLTLQNKLLFRESRERARAQGYKYVWIKNGTVLVREADTSPAFAIRCRNDINKIQRKEAL
ncbi:unnamed protein product [Plutella xylostella]|nr:uncharacterized protein LOC119694390 [Plutella xylostella]CAG9138735.1 unnamed protein product [Plutella xylostella]